MKNAASTMKVLSLKEKNLQKAEAAEVAENDSKVADKASKTINTGVAMLDALVNSVVGGYKKR